MTNSFRKSLRRLLRSSELVPCRQADRRTWLRDRPADRIEGRARAACAGAATSQLDPQIGQPQAVRDPTLRRHVAVLAYATVVEAHAAVEQDHVDIGPCVAHLHF